MIKHSTLIRNNGHVIYYNHKGDPEIWGGTKFLETKRGEHRIFSLKREEQKIFIKRIFWVLSFACVEICSETLLPEHLDYHEKIFLPLFGKEFSLFSFIFSDH